MTRPAALGVTVSALIVVATIGPAGADPAAAPTGVLCLRKLPAALVFASEGKGSFDPSYEDTAEASTRRMAQHPRLTVTVDRHPPVTIDQQQGACVDGLPLAGRHVARVERDGHSFRSARFTFPKDASLGRVLELHYDPFYATVQIEPHRSRAALVGTPATTCSICTTAARAALPAAPPVPALDWLLGEWTIPGADRSFHLTWARSPEGVVGRLERVEPDGKRALATVYELLTDGDALTLRVEAVTQLGVGAVLDGEVRERAGGVVDRWTMPPPVEPKQPRTGLGAYSLDGGVVGPQFVGFTVPGDQTRWLRARLPVAVELRLVDAHLLVNENRRYFKFKSWQSFRFERVAPAASPKP